MTSRTSQPSPSWRTGVFRTIPPCLCYHQQHDRFSFPKLPRSKPGRVSLVLRVSLWRCRFALHRTCCPGFGFCYMHWYGHFRCHDDGDGIHHPSKCNANLVSLMNALSCLHVCTSVFCISLFISLLSFRMRWLNKVPFMTYGFRALMTTEYAGKNFTVSTDSLPLSDGLKQTALSARVPEEVSLPGDFIIKFFEMEGYATRTDILVLVAWIFGMHLVSIMYLLWKRYKNRRMFVYSDK